MLSEFNGQSQRNESKMANKYEIWKTKRGDKYNKEGRFQFADCHYGTDFDRVLDGTHRQRPTQGRPTVDSEWGFG
jgi:hypothetical protein